MNRLLAVGTLCLVTSWSAWARGPLVLTASEEDQTSETLGNEGSFAGSVYFSSVLPKSRPFSAVESSGRRTDFRFQSSNAIGVEVTYGLKPNLNLGLSTGYETLKTSLDSSSGSLVELRDAKLRILPLMAIAQYRFRQAVWSPEVEGALGFAMMKLSTDSTNLAAAAKNISQSQTAILAQLGLGLVVSWTDSLLVGAQLGFRYTMQDEKIYDGGAEKISWSALSGVTAKAQLRYLF